MQQLHLVGFTTDLDGLIFSSRKGAKSGGYHVALDARFMAQIKEAVRLQTGVDLEEEVEAELAEETGKRSRRGRSVRHVDSALAPKDIQARLRAGRSVEEVAAEAGVEDEWIMRFATPVLAEQTRVIERALGLVCRTPRKGVSSQPLGIAVAWNLADKGLLLAPDELAAGWSAYHLRDAEWVLRFRYVSRNRTQLAQWECDPAAGTLVALNRLASEIGYVESGRRRRWPSIRDTVAGETIARPVLEASARHSESTAKQPARDGTSRRRPAKRRPAAKAVPAKRTASAKRPAPAKKAAPAKRVAVKGRVVKRSPVKKAKKAAVKKSASPVRKPAAKRAPAKKSAARRAPATKRRASVKKAAPRKAPAKKARRPRPDPRQAVPRQGAPRQAAPQPPARQRPAPQAPAPQLPAVRRPPSLQPTEHPLRPLRPLRASPPPLAAGNGLEAESPAAPTSAPPEPVVRQRPLVAVRRIDSRQRSFPPPPAQRVTRPAPTTPMERARPDGDEENVVIISAPRASE